MTHPTDEELDALVERLKEPWNQRQSRHVAEEFDAADAITILREQLAEMKAELARRVDMHECAMAERDDATLYSEEQKARADRAEAALAAQIEADAGIVDQMFYNPTTDADFSDDTNLNDWAGWATIEQLREWSSEAIRAQPHDRSAIDRLLAEAREKALREAILEGMRIATFTPIEQVHAAIDDAILALIEADHAQP